MVGWGIFWGGLGGKTAENCGWGLASKTRENGGSSGEGSGALEDEGAFGD